MLRLIESDRRAFLSAGSLALGGLTLSQLLSRGGAAAEATARIPDKSVILLFLHGGPSQTETFDPKMTAPSGIRSVNGEVKTSLPGITFGASLPKLAKWAHKMAVVRSFVPGDGNHDIKPVVSRFSLNANVGSLFARVAGTNHRESAMPTNVALFPRAINPKAQARNLNFGHFDATGTLGRAYAPFTPGAGANLQSDMELNIPRNRLDDRRTLLTRLDGLRRAWERSEPVRGINRFQAQAFETVLSAAAKAFDLSNEDPRVVARYDTQPLIRPDAISKKWNNHKNYLDNAQTLGKLLLMARRLCEAGCGFVTVTTNFVWDMHADQNNATMEEGMGYVGLPFDHAVSAFLEDVEARGLSEHILLVACGEMGRTPKINKKGGRDHWGRLAPLMLAGGGLKMGQVIGQSTRDAGEPASDPVTIPNLIATIMRVLLDPGETRLIQGVPRSVIAAVTEGRPIQQLF